MLLVASTIGSVPTFILSLLISGSKPCPANYAVVISYKALYVYYGSAPWPSFKTQRLFEPGFNANKYGQYTIAPRVVVYQ